MGSPRLGNDYDASHGSFCQLCGAWRGSLGLEPTPEMFVEHTVEVFREVHRVLRDDGVCWINLGDSYASDTKGSGGIPPGSIMASRPNSLQKAQRFPPVKVQHGLKPKDLCGMPWRVAFALQADGWYLRSDIIWAKPNPMPESVTDRPTKAHEYVFLLTKKPRYFYDQEAVREPYKEASIARSKYRTNKIGKGLDLPGGASHTKGGNNEEMITPHPSGRNMITVWEFATQPRPEAHFATFPDELASRCILAGTSEAGCCPECGKPWVRMVETEKRSTPCNAKSYEAAHGPDGRDHERASLVTTTLGFRPDCECNAGEPQPCTVLDPFVGSGTVARISENLGRRWIGIDISEEYIEKIATPKLAQRNMFSQDLGDGG